MATTATTTMDKHIVGYDSYIADNWNTLEQWERDAYELWTATAGGKTKPAKRAKANESGDIPRTVSLAYMLLIAGLFLFPMHVQSAVLALGAINLGRGKAGHGFVQIALAAAALALYSMGHTVTWDNITALQDRFASGS